MKSLLKLSILLLISLVMLQLAGCHDSEHNEGVIRQYNDNENTELTTMNANIIGYGSHHETGDQFISIQMLDERGEHSGFAIAYIENVVGFEGDSLRLTEYLSHAMLIQIKYDGIIHDGTTHIYIYPQEITVLERDYTSATLDYIMETYPDEYKVIFDAYFDLIHGEGYSANRNVSDNLKSTIRAYFSESGSHYWNYPEFWGGEYIDEQGRLVINIATDYLPMDEAKAYFSQIVDIEPIIFNSVEYSYNQLRDLVDNYLRDHPNIEDFSHGLYYVNVPENRVQIGLMNYNEEEIQRFRETIMDSPMIIFAPDRAFVQ